MFFFFSIYLSLCKEAGHYLSFSFHFFFKFISWVFLKAKTDILILFSLNVICCQDMKSWKVHSFVLHIVAISLPSGKLTTVVLGAVLPTKSFFFRFIWVNSWLFVLQKLWCGGVWNGEHLSKLILKIHLQYIDIQIQMAVIPES